MGWFYWNCNPEYNTNLITSKQIQFFCGEDSYKKAIHHTETTVTILKTISAPKENKVFLKSSRLYFKGNT